MGHNFRLKWPSLQLTFRDWESTPTVCSLRTTLCTYILQLFLLIFLIYLIFFDPQGNYTVNSNTYFTSKPNQKGNMILRTTRKQSFIKEVEFYVLHFLHNLCNDKVLKKMTLFNIELAEKHQSTFVWEIHSSLTCLFWEKIARRMAKCQFISMREI